MQYDRTQWAHLATRGIVSPKERTAARQELLDHIDDHMDALMAAGRSREQARVQAVAAMGDPQQTARLLRMAHQPVLTRLLQGCRWVAAFLVLCVVWNWLVLGGQPLPRWYRTGITDNADFLGQGSGTDWACDRPEGWFRLVTCDESIHVAGYTLRAEEAWVCRAEGEDYLTWLVITIRPDCFWQDKPKLYHPFRMTCGEVQAKAFRGSPDDHPLHIVQYDKAPPGQMTFYAQIRTPHDPGQVTLDYLDPDGGFTLEVDLRGGTYRE